MRFATATITICVAAFLGVASAAPSSGSLAIESKIAVLLARTAGSSLGARSSSFATSGGDFPWGSDKDNDKSFSSSSESSSITVGGKPVSSTSSSKSTDPDSGSSSTCKDDGSQMKTGKAVMSSCNGKDSMTVGGVTFSDTDDNDDKKDHDNGSSGQAKSTLLALVAVAVPIIAFA